MPPRKPPASPSRVAFAPILVATLPLVALVALLAPRPPSTAASSDGARPSSPIRPRLVEAPPRVGAARPSLPSADAFPAPPVNADERLAVHALALTPGPARAALLDEALARWTLLDPAAVADWILVHLTDAAEFDRAAALLVRSTDTIHRPTATALAWAESLADPDRRLAALAHVLREWDEQDPAAVEAYLAASPALTPAQRRELVAALTPFLPET